MSDKKQMLTIIAFIILLIAIPVTVYFVRQSQIFKSRASATSEAEFLDASGNPLPVDSNGIAQTTNPNLKLKITKVATASASPSVRLDPRLILSHARGQYPVRNNDFLVYGGQDAYSLGFQGIEVYISSQDVCSAGAKFPQGFYQTRQGCPFSNLTAVVQNDRYRELLAMNFKTFFLTADGAANTAHSFLINGTAFNETQVTALYNEFYDFARYMLATYRNTSKTFIIQTPNEMDWHMLTSQDSNLEPSSTAIQNAITYWNTIQRAVVDAREEFPAGTVKLYHACEVNLVVKGMDSSNKKTAANSVIPSTHCDLYGYSAYETIFLPDTARYGQTLTYLKQKAPDSIAFEANNVYVSELGTNQQEIGETASMAILQNAYTEAFKQNSPYVLFWQLYDNECQVFNPTQNSQCRGFWIRKPQGLELSPVYTQFLLTNYRI